MKINFDVFVFQTLRQSFFRSLLFMGIGGMAGAISSIAIPARWPIAYVIEIGTDISGQLVQSQQVMIESLFDIEFLKRVSNENSEVKKLLDPQDGFFSAVPIRGTNAVRVVVAGRSEQESFEVLEKIKTEILLNHKRQAENTMDKLKAYRKEIDAYRNLISSDAARETKEELYKPYMIENVFAKVSALTDLERRLAMMQESKVVSKQAQRSSNFLAWRTIRYTIFGAGLIWILGLLFMIVRGLSHNRV